ncbi:MAG: ATP-grasp domain-containing protein [Candidatus Paceibacterota bacterium]
MCIDWKTNRSEIPEDSIVWGRYSVLPFYHELEKDLATKGSRLINSHEQHLYVADMRNWYPDLVEFTPKTWFEGWNKIPDDKSYVLKGLTNSRKHQWNRMMFAPTKDDVRDIAGRLLDDSLISQQGIAVREYVPLVKLEDSIYNGLPISNEWRCFFYKDILIQYGFYWSFSDKRPEYNDLPTEAMDLLAKVKEIVSPNINFWVVDIAFTQDKKWIVIELNDGQMAGLSCIEPYKFYKFLKGVWSF